MAAVTQTTNRYHGLGNVTMVTATFTSPADTNTWDTGLGQIDFAGFTIVDAAGAASAAISAASIAGGVVTLDIQGTVSSALALAAGVG